jgi:hypothetical protein
MVDYIQTFNQRGDLYEFRRIGGYAPHRDTREFFFWLSSLPIEHYKNYDAGDGIQRLYVYEFVDAARKKDFQRLHRVCDPSQPGSINWNRVYETKEDEFIIRIVLGWALEWHKMSDVIHFLIQCPFIDNTKMFMPRGGWSIFELLVIYNMTEGIQLILANSNVEYFAHDYTAFDNFWWKVYHSWAQGTTADTILMVLAHPAFHTELSFHRLLCFATEYIGHSRVVEFVVKHPLFVDPVSGPKLQKELLSPETMKRMKERKQWDLIHLIENRLGRPLTLIPIEDVPIVLQRRQTIRNKL